MLNGQNQDEHPSSCSLVA